MSRRHWNTAAGWLSVSAVALVVLTSTASSGAPPDTAGESILHGDVPSFRGEVMAILSRSGCSLGTCHGNQNGKGGLKLSLRGQDPEADYVTLTRQMAARRTNVLAPHESLLLRKPSMQIPHEGGRRFAESSPEYELLRRWIAAGMPADSDSAARLQALKVIPNQVTIYAPEHAVSLRAVAVLTDGTEHDVSHLAVFESSDPGIDAALTGVVRFPASVSARRTSVTVRYLNRQTTCTVEWVPERPDFAFSAPASDNAVDRAVFGQLQRLKINPSPVCDDRTFLRRVFLDLTGLLPSAARARAFLQSDAPNKRSLLIDELLASQEFIDFQTLRWADLLRVEDKTLDAKGVQAFHHWIRESMAADKPLNVFAAEIIAARGSTYSEPPSNFYRALRTPEERSESVAQVFLGIRLQCAKCHNHPFDRWTQDDYYGWTNFFAHVDYKILENRRRDQNDKHEFDGEQIVFMKESGDVRNPTTKQTAGLRFLSDDGSGPSNLKPQDVRDRLQTLAGWLGHSANHRFAMTQANRIWFQLMGTGIVDPVDDFRATNPPSNPELLDVITGEFVQSGYSVRHLMRLILNSKTWQLATEPNDTNASDETLYSHVIPRRLSAEQTLDAVGQVLQTQARFGGHPEGTRAVQLTGVRNGGNRYSRPENGDRFLSLFGKPSRLQTCECERTGETSLAQTLELVSGELISELLQDPQNCVARAVSSDQQTDDFLTELFWAALSRPPATTELSSLRQHIESRPSRREGLQDAVWAVLNSNEFLLRY